MRQREVINITHAINREPHHTGKPQTPHCPCIHTWVYIGWVSLTEVPEGHCGSLRLVIQRVGARARRPHRGDATITVHVLLLLLLMMRWVALIGVLLLLLLHGCLLLLVLLPVAVHAVRSLTSAAWLHIAIAIAVVGVGMSMVSLRLMMRVAIAALR